MNVDLRVYLPIPDLGRQFAAYLGTPMRARGYPPAEGDHALIVEVAPGLAIERVIDLALKSVPDVEPGIHYVERQFGVLEVHSPDDEQVARAGAAGRIVSYQVCDWITPLPADTLLGRGMMGDGHVDLAAFTRSVAAAGYTGDVEVEIFNADVWEAPGPEVVATCARRYVELIQPWL